MAASSSSGSSYPKYDVFRSFRGSDTGRSFTSHLLAALVRNQMETFVDDDLDPSGDALSSSPACLQKIEQSYVSVVVFSENYAESQRCLDELVQILECVKTKGQMALPVFYQVDPTDVQELTGSYGQAMAMHENKFQGEPGKVENWKHALKEISNRSGRALQDTMSEAQLIEEIVNDIWKKLLLMPSSDLDDGFIGMHSRVKEVESLLSINEVHSIGIWGMGGIGKTALAENLFNKISADFEARCFVNVREESERYSLVGLRDRILSAVLKVKDLNIGTPSILPMPIRRKLQMKKVLVVLDDVSGHQELETLAGQHNLYGPGSKIIVTSRHKQVLQKGCDRTYEVKKLGYSQALKLFKWHAFKENHPTEMLMEISSRVLKYVDGIPLALKVLGSCLYAKGVREWESVMEKLEKIPDKAITEVLKISFDGLEEHEKSIFLDMACFFNGADKDHVKRFWDACSFYATDGIGNLEDKSLIEFSENRLRMHDLLCQMGQDIVRRECIQEPGNRSRLWDTKDVYHALSKQRVSEKIEGISLDMSKVSVIELSSTIFLRMHNLRLLRFYTLCSSEIKIHLPDGLQLLPDELRLLHWCQYPLKFFPSNFYHSNLVELHMQNSRVEQLWDSDQSMGSLKVIKLNNSRDLIRILDLAKVPNLEVLNLRGCIKLEEVPSSIGYLRKLTSLTLDGCLKLEEVPSSIGCLKSLSYLSLADCRNLSRFPSCFDMTNLEYLSLHFCSKVDEFPKIPSNIKQLHLSGTAIQDVPSSIGQFSCLRKLGFGYCTRLKSLPSSIGDLELLEELYLVGCPKLRSIQGCTRNLKSLVSLRITCQDPDGLPENLGNLDSLEELIIVDSAIKEVPHSVGHLSKLKDLSFWKCKSIALSPFSAFNSLSILHIMDCGISEIPCSLGSLTSLTELHLREQNLESIPTSIKELSKLLLLVAQGCKRLQSLPELPPSLKILDLFNCRTLSSIPALGTEFDQDCEASQEDFNFGNCSNLDEEACGKIVDDAQHKILRLVKWMFSEEYGKMESEEEQESTATTVTGDLMFCLPGSKVPQWFEYQSIGSSLTIMADSDKLLDLRRLAFCAVVACDGPYTLDTSTVKCDLHLITKSGHSLKLQSFYQSPSFLEETGERFLQSNHVFLWYHSDLWYDQRQYYFTEAIFEFYTMDREGERVACEVTSCGVTAIGKKFEMRIASSDDDDDNEQDKYMYVESAPKRLRISEAF